MQHKYNDDVALCCVLLIVQDDRLLCYDASLPFPGLVWAGAGGSCHRSRRQATGGGPESGQSALAMSPAQTPGARAL